MRPAFTVIFLTTLIGAGQGLFLALYACELLGLVAPSEQSFYVHGSLSALVLLAGGLLASFFHLGRPERAWRSATMWKTSWLSREVIALPLSMILITLYAGAHHFELVRSTGIDTSLIIGAVGTLCVIALFVCTGMIYACVRFLQEWASPWTVVNYTLLGCASGFTLATAHAAEYAPQAVRILGLVAIVLTLFALTTRVASLVRNAKIKPRADVQSAVGVRHNNISQQTVGFMGGSFNTREFFHGKSADTMNKVKQIFLSMAFVFPVPLVLLGLWRSSAEFFLIAFACQYIGLLFERWYFFAQANHPQNLYYRVST